MIRKFGAVLADILAVIGFGLSLFIACRVFPNSDNTCFDYQAVIVGIIAAIFTLLVGWNIYQMVDWNEKLKRLDSLQTEVEKQINYIHNKADYNQALVYGMMSQSASVAFAPNETEVLKQLMIHKGLTAIKTLSHYPNAETEISSIVATLIKGLNNSKDVQLSKKFITEMVMLCGEVQHKDNIEQFDYLVSILQGI